MKIHEFRHIKIAVGKKKQINSGGAVTHFQPPPMVSGSNWDSCGLFFASDRKGDFNFG